MENLQYSKILRKNWEVVALVMGVTVVLSLIISLFQPFQYAATTQILIIQKQEKNLDAYTATKSAERIGKNLANIIYTSSFYNDVIESDSQVENKFPKDARERRKDWKKNVDVNVIPETGILEIDVYDVDKTFASQLVRTISHVLVNKGADYHGGGADVEIKIVDDVFVSKYPARPNLAVNSVLSLIIGLILGVFLVILTEAKKYKETAVFNDNTAIARPAEEAYLAEQLSDFQNQWPQMQDYQDNVGLPAKVTVIKTMYDHLA